MSKQPQYSLLLGPFTRKNQQKYPKLRDLTLDDLVISNVEKQADGVRTAQIDSETKDFTAPGQKWKCCTVHDSKILTTTGAALADKAEAAQQAEPGVYVVGSGAEAKYVVVISDGTAEAQAPDVATGILINALNYDIPSDDITAENGVILVDGATIYGEVEYVTGKAATTVIEADPEPTDLNETN